MNEKICKNCGGKMVFKETIKACEFGTSADETGFTVDLYECEDCGTEEID